MEQKQIENRWSILVHGPRCRIKRRTTILVRAAAAICCSAIDFHLWAWPKTLPSLSDWTAKGLQSVALKHLIDLQSKWPESRSMLLAVWIQCIRCRVSVGTRTEHPLLQPKCANPWPLTLDPWPLTLDPWRCLLQRVYTGGHQSVREGFCQKKDSGNDSSDISTDDGTKSSTRMSTECSTAAYSRLFSRAYFLWSRRVWVLQYYKYSTGSTCVVLYCSTAVLRYSTTLVLPVQSRV